MHWMYWIEKYITVKPTFLARFKNEKLKCLDTFYWFGCTMMYLNINWPQRNIFSTTVKTFYLHELCRVYTKCHYLSSEPINKIIKKTIVQHCMVYGSKTSGIVPGNLNE